ncbi:MAG: alpha/beta hydrolase [Planctomycetaceae bacterium]
MKNIRVNKDRVIVTTENPDESVADAESIDKGTDSKRATSWSSRLKRGILIYVLIPYLSVTLGFAVFQRSLIYRPLVTTKINLPTTVPGTDVAWEGVEVSTFDGVTLNGWLLKHQRTETNEPKLVLYFPGNSENRSKRVYDLLEVGRSGYDVLIVDYRGYGDNAGSPSESAIRQDALAIWNDAVTKRGYKPSRIVVFGESLGGAVAIQLTSSLAEQNVMPRKVMVVSTFNRLGDVVGELYPMFPFRYLLWDQYDSQTAARNIRCPLTIIHGKQDDLVPPVLAQRLFDSLPKSLETKGLWSLHLIPGMTHNDIHGPTLQRELEEVTIAN